MKNMILGIAVIATALGFSGCVSSGKYRSLQASYDNLQAQYNEQKVSLAESRTGGKSLEQQLADARATNAQLRKDYDDMRLALNASMDQNSQGNKNIAKLVDEINASNRYIQQLVAAKSKSDSLNLVLTSNLTRSLSASETKDVDVRVLKGVVYISLADNMLFKSGSYDINPAAMDVLSKIAKIIKDYSNYDVLVEGNTDNVPISRTNIRNNWDLSTLRASSVVQVLQDRFNVDPARMTAGGRGEYNPVASNSTAEGRQQNRRTQIIITPSLTQFMDLIDKAPEADYFRDNK
ncbi:MAG: OmpA family protein [Pseudoflavonifractor sp.]|nr:OmpA family protein [Alloprevotella sp.]MCM1117269.1 OmpA family protein [Pseudoflavonifractor sp.]